MQRLKVVVKEEVVVEEIPTIKKQPQQSCPEGVDARNMELLTSKAVVNEWSQTLFYDVHSMSYTGSFPSFCPAMLMLTLCPGLIHKLFFKKGNIDISLPGFTESQEEEGTHTFKQCNG